SHSLSGETLIYKLNLFDLTKLLSESSSENPTKTR
ncbi:hypothetical protein F443_23064, partial [Phytophthora nicotianae P1569]